MLKHTIYREGSRWGVLEGSIAREIPLCSECYTALITGCSLATLVQRAGLPARSVPIPQALSPAVRMGKRPSEVSPSHN